MKELTILFKNGEEQTFIPLKGFKVNFVTEGLRFETRECKVNIEADLIDSILISY